MLEPRELKRVDPWPDSPSDLPIVDVPSGAELFWRVRTRTAHSGSVDQQIDLVVVRDVGNLLGHVAHQVRVELVALRLFNRLQVALVPLVDLWVAVASSVIAAPLVGLGGRLCRIPDLQPRGADTRGGLRDAGELRP